MPFSRGSSQPRDRTWVSHIADRFFYHLSHHRTQDTGQAVPMPSEEADAHKHQTCHCLDLGLPSLQDSGEQASAVDKPSSL